MLFGLPILQVVAYALIIVGIVLLVIDLIRHKKQGLGFMDVSFLIPFIIGALCAVAGVVITWLFYLNVL